MVLRVALASVTPKVDMNTNMMMTESLLTHDTCLTNVTSVRIRMLMAERSRDTDKEPRFAHSFEVANILCPLIGRR